MNIKLPIEKAIPFANEIVKCLKPFCNRIEILNTDPHYEYFDGTINLLIEPSKIAVAFKGQLNLFESTEVKIQDDPRLFETISKFKIYSCSLEKGEKEILFWGEKRISYKIILADNENYGLKKILNSEPVLHFKNYLVSKLAKAGYEFNGEYVMKQKIIVSVNEEEDLYNLIGKDFIPQRFRHRYTLWYSDDLH